MRQLRTLSQGEFPVVAKRVIIWCIIAFLAILNGAARDFFYAPFTGELAAHQISTVVLLALIGAAAWLAEARWPLRSPNEAVRMGDRRRCLQAGRDHRDQADGDQP